MQNRPESRSPRLLPPIPNENSDSCPHTPLSKHRTSKLSFTGWNASWLRKKKETEENEMLKYMEKNKDFVEHYVMENVPTATLEKWLRMKIHKTKRATRSPEDEKTINIDFSGKQKLMDWLNNKEEARSNEIPLEMAAALSSSIKATNYRLFKLFPDHPNFVQYFVENCSMTSNPVVMVRAEPNEVVLVLEVARQGACMKISRNDDPSRFPPIPEMLFKKEEVEEQNHVLYVPVLKKSGKTCYVIEMWRNSPFTDVEVLVCSNFLVWGSLSLHYCNLYLDKKRERNMSDFLLDVVKAIFEEMVSLDQLIKRILEFAQRLVNADRASLFLVDYRNFELVSTVFDLKFEPGLDRDMEKKEIRMPINRGIAGHVAMSGETMNIPDAYSDYRFNREVDEATGYKTISILCMPIKVEGRIIGVVQMVNKRDDDNFGHDDEVSFEIFSTFFGLALHHARLYDRIMRKEQKYRVALEVLSYHNTCRENEVLRMLHDNEKIGVDLNDFYLDPFRFDEFQKCKCVVTMFDDLFDMSNFDVTTVTRFILTVKKNYRTVPYHNFDHGWSVAHAMYVILKNDHKRRFDYKMRLALFVACLCHDLDHRGYTNKYMSETASPLAAMYTTSTLEHHHFNITVTILQQDGHNIFSHVSSEDYKEILGFIRQCILATDLAAFFPNLENIKKLCGEGASQKFSWAIPRHRDLAMAISMTAADLSASAKPWEIQNKTVKVIFEEFYDQGDKERAAGRFPIPMMDRNKPEEQPSSQVGFLSQICIPCYTMLHKILPNTKPMLAMALKNLDRWQARADRISRKLRKKKEKQLQEEAAGQANTPEVAGTDASTNSESKDPDAGAISWEEEELVIDKEKLSILPETVVKTEEVASWIEEDEGVVMANRALKAICIGIDKI